MYLQSEMLVIIGSNQQIKWGSANRQSLIGESRSRASHHVELNFDCMGVCIGGSLRISWRLVWFAKSSNVTTHTLAVKYSTYIHM